MYSCNIHPHERQFYSLRLLLEQSIEKYYYILPLWVKASASMNKKAIKVVKRARDRHLTLIIL